jgi:hypothetical protein
MTQLDAISSFLCALPIYFINGLLVILYDLLDHMPEVVGLAAGAVVMAIPDAEVQRRAGFRPRRQDWDGMPAVPRTAQAMTALVLVLWLCAQWQMGAPVPWIGAAMWIAGLACILALPAQRFNLLWYVKGGLAMYALAVIGSRLYLSYASQSNPNDWAAMIGSQEAAATIVAGTESSVTTIVLWALWLVIPLGYFSMLFQQVFANPMSLISPWQGAQDLLRHLRSPGSD